ncbi:MAG: DUF2244 domain-containing protein [Rhodospirillaceae bacterium]|nr:DUF2244 domain-containing protein [Rhodospirillaceae bacterium]
MVEAITINDKQIDGEQTLGFSMILRPRRSADPKVAYILCGWLAAIWCSAGLFFVFMGGWPVMGFFGGEFIFIAIMVRIFIKRTEVVETVEITTNQITVAKRERGIEEKMNFQSYWAQVHFNGSNTENTALEIRSHGEAVEIGKFLSAAEKTRVARQLDDVLRRLKTQNVAH